VFAHVQANKSRAPAFRIVANILATVIGTCDASRSRIMQINSLAKRWANKLPRDGDQVSPKSKSRSQSQSQQPQWSRPGHMQNQDKRFN